MRAKCVCIEDWFDSNDNIPTFKEGKTYEYIDQQFVTREIPEGFNVEIVGCLNGYYMFFKKEQGYGCFYDYFKTIKEIRNEKLNKINETIG